MKLPACSKWILFFVAVFPVAGRAVSPRSLLLTTEPGATVVWEGVEIGKSDQNGRLEIDNLPAGKFRITVQKEGFRSHQGTVEIDSERQAKTIPLQPFPGQEGSVSGAGAVADRSPQEDSRSANPPAMPLLPETVPPGETNRIPPAEIPDLDRPIPSDEEHPVARHGVFRKILALTGQLVARSSHVVSVPRNDSLWSFLVTDLASEGSLVQEGDLLVRFDSTELAQKILELEKKREDARIQIAQKEAEQEARLQDLKLAVATAEKNFNTAALYVGIDRSLIAASEADRYQFDHQKSGVELEKARERLAGHAEAAAAELAISQLELDRAQIELEGAQNELSRMSVRAPTGGLLIHGTTNEGRKVEVGDTLFKGNQVAFLPDMSRVLVRATTFDRDFALLAVGDPAVITLDAYPRRKFAGVVTTLPEAARPRDRNSELNLFTVEVLLQDVDLTVMRPGMTARVEIPVDFPDSIIVPRRSVGLAPDGSSFLAPLDSADPPIPIEVLDGNAHQLRILGEVADGLRLQDLQPREMHIQAAGEADWIEVKRQDVRFTVSATGVLKAARSVAIIPPSIPDTWRFKIIRMAAEGTTVGEGDTVLAFDPSDQMRRLQEEEANLKKVEQELEKVQASQVLSQRDLELELEEARVQLEKADNKFRQARQFDSSLKIQEAEQEAILAHTRVDLLGRKLASTRRHSQLQIQILEETAQLHRSRIQVAEDAIQRFQVRAPRSGVVIYKRNWNNQKKQVGSEAHLGETILALPELDSLMIEGQVAEVDSGRLKVGQIVEISLDAIPERTMRGRITEIGNVFVQPSRDRPIRVLNIRVEFDEVDAERMRPEMVARLEVVIDHYRDVLSIPLSIIQLQGERSFVWVEQGSEMVRREIEIGETNGVVAVVTRGLEEGDRVLAAGSHRAKR